MGNQLSRPIHCHDCGVRYPRRQSWHLVMTTPLQIHYRTTCPVCNRDQCHAERQPMAFEESDPDTLASRLAAGAIILACLILGGLHFWE